nr:MAG TPA_asm: hypothetical protein [Bacteriophage sp.]
MKSFFICNFDSKLIKPIHPPSKVWWFCWLNNHKTKSLITMSYFILMGRRIPKQAVTGFKFQNETDNIRPFLSIRIRGKEEIIPLKDKREILSVKAHLCSVFSGFVKIGDWYLKMSEVKEYKPVTAEDMNPYILFKTSKFGNIKVRFPKDEDMNAELLVLDQLFDVE